MKSVKMKIIVLVLSCLLISSAAIGFASILNSKKVISSDSSQIMNLMCDNKAEEINAILDQIQQSVNTLTVYALHQIDDLQRFQTDPEYVDSYSNHLLDIAMNAAENTNGALTVYIRFNPEFTDPASGIFCSKSDVDGTFKKLVPTDLSLYNPKDKEHVGWFYEPAQKKAGVWMSPYFNQNINVEMISYVVPFYVNHVFVGVVGMDIDFGILRDIVASTYVYNEGYAFLTDETAHIIYHKDLPRDTALMEYNQGEFLNMAIQLQHSSSGNDLVSYTYKGQDRKLAFCSLKNDMRIALTAPIAEIDKQANTLIMQIGIVTLFIMLISAILTILFTRKLVKPLLELNVAAKKIADGDLSVSIVHQSNDEVGTLAESFRETVKHLHKYISYINELAYRDSLTGVKNKTAYLEVIRRLDELTLLKRPEFAVVVFDINGLKEVNDTYGHDFGDMLITDACKIICNTFKKSPIYRIGGDEFVAILENIDYSNYVSLLAQFEEEINAYNIHPHNNIKISVARGIAIFTEDIDLSYNDVFKRADNCMYLNKAEQKEKKKREKIEPSNA